jgi:hypothetical protein
VGAALICDPLVAADASPRCSNSGCLAGLLNEPAAVGCDLDVVSQEFSRWGCFAHSRTRGDCWWTNTKAFTSRFHKAGFQPYTASGDSEITDMTGKP